MKPASARKFVPGHAYFIVVFEDENLTIPIIQTIVYREDEKLSGATTRYLFDELRLGAKPSTFFVDVADADHLVLDNDALINKLRESFAGKLPGRSR